MLACGSARHQAPSTLSPNAVSAAPKGRGSAAGSRAAAPMTSDPPPGDAACGAGADPHPAASSAATATPAVIRTVLLMHLRRFGPAIGCVRPAGTNRSGSPPRQVAAWRTAAASRELGAQGVRPLIPELAEPLEPYVDLPERRAVHGVQPPGTRGTGGGEPALPQHAQVHGHRRLGNPEFLLDHRADRPRGLLPVGEQFQDPAPDRVTEDVEGVHVATMPASAYISQDCYHSVLISTAAGPPGPLRCRLTWGLCFPGVSADAEGRRGRARRPMGA